MNKKSVAAIAGIVLTTALPSLFQIQTYDTFFHLAAGRQMLQTFTLPAADMFSYTFKGEVWHNHSPLFQAVIAVVHKATGFEGLSFFQWIMTAGLMLTAILSAIRSGVSLRLGCILGVLPLLVFQGTVVPRPHVFGFLFFQLALAVIYSAEKQDRPRRLYALPVIYLFWLLSHGSHVILPAAMIGCLFGSLRKKRHPFLYAYGLGLLLCAVLVLLINPSSVTQAGAHLDSSFLSDEVAEWHGFSPQLLFGTGRGVAFITLWLLTLAGATVQSGLFSLEGRSVAPEDRMPVHPGLLLLGIMVLSLSSFRMAPLFLIGAAPLWIPPAAFMVRAVIESVARSLAPVARACARPWFRDLATVLFIAAAVIVCAARDDTHVWGPGLEHARFPEKAVTVLDRSPFGMRVYNAYNWGGYLMFARKTPSDGVFVDGRAVTLYSSEFLRAFTAAYTDPGLFEALVRKYRCDSVLMPVTSRRTAPLRAYLEKSPRWVRYYRDDVSAIYVPATSPIHR